MNKYFKIHRTVQVVGSFYNHRLLHGTKMKIIKKKNENNIFLRSDGNLQDEVCQLEQKREVILNL